MNRGLPTAKVRLNFLKDNAHVHTCKRRSHSPDHLPLRVLRAYGIARSGQDSIGRVAADWETGADNDADNSKGCGRSYELVAICPEAWAVTWGKSVDVPAVRVKSSSGEWSPS